MYKCSDHLPAVEGFRKPAQGGLQNGVTPVKVKDGVGDVRPPLVGIGLQLVKDVLVAGDDIAEVGDGTDEDHVQVGVPAPVLVHQHQSYGVAEIREKWR